MDKTTATNLKVLVGGLTALSLYVGSGAPRFTGKAIDYAFCKATQSCDAPGEDPVKKVRTVMTTNDVLLDFNDAVERYQEITAAPENAQFMLAPATQVPFDIEKPEGSLDDFTQFVVWQQYSLQGHKGIFDSLQGVLDDVEKVRTDLRMARARGQYIVPEAKP